MNTETNWNNINWTEMEKELAIMQDNIVMTTIDIVGIMKWQLNESNKSTLKIQ